MVSIVGKKKKGNTYYYVVKSERVNGRPKIVWQKYIGTAERILELKEEADPTVGVNLKSFSMGREAALTEMSRELRFVEIVDDVVEKREIEGLSVGEYLLIQIIGRATGHLSRQKIAKWFPKSVLDFWYTFPHKMNSHNLCNQLDYVDKEEIRGIEKRLGQRLIELGFSPSIIYWDTTNFYTEIQEENSLAETGYSKDGKHEKKLIGTALGTTEDGIPFFHETYPGNERDPQLLNRLIDKIVKRIEDIGFEPEDFSIVLDCGNNNDKNIPKIKETGMGIIGRLRNNQVKDLMRISLEEYKKLDPKKYGKDTERVGYRSSKEVYGTTYTVVIEYNPKTAKKQRLTYEGDLKTAKDNLKEIKDKLNKSGRGRPPTTAGTYKRVRKAIPEDVRSVFDIKVKTVDTVAVDIEYSIKPGKDKERRNAFGKRAIFTDNEDWSTEKIISVYNGRYRVEDDFRVLKNPNIIPFKPEWLSKPNRIRTHAFLCIMGLLFYRLVHWKLRDMDLSFEEIVEKLEEIRLGLVQKKTGGSPRFVVEQMDKEKAKIFSELNMSKRIPE